MTSYNEDDILKTFFLEILLREALTSFLGGPRMALSGCVCV